MTWDTLPVEVRALLACGSEGTELFTLPEGDPDDTARASGSAGDVVIKRARGLPASEWIALEASALAALASTDLPVPRVLGVVEAKDDASYAWLVTTLLPGEPLSHTLRTSDPAARTEWCRRLGHMLARIHATPVPAELARVDATPWERRRRERLPAERADEALASVDLDRELARVLVHGDFTPDNVLARDDEISGVIDWPGAGLGDPRFDVATALLSLGGSGADADADASAFVTAYLTAREPSPAAP
jgi:aminoglycoside phosphotransferase (APT) family kinase protein